MQRPRFERLQAVYGCHDGEWDLPGGEEPVVITGPNGSGKSTLVEAMVRTLFGFDRRRGDESSRMDARRPWEADAMRGAVTLSRDGERFQIRRDFLTHRVRVLSLDDGLQHFEGDGNPGGRNQEALHYRKILADLLGLAELDAYDRTLFIRQGALPETSLGEHLLRVAAGGHARVEQARREIARNHRSITRRPLHAAASAAINPRELEKMDDEIGELRSRLEAARTARERRGPLALEREQTAERLQRLDAEIQQLEDAQSAVARSGTVELQARHVRDWMRNLERTRGQLARDREELEAAQAQRRDAEAGGVYPPDFAERLARVELRWADLDLLRSKPVRWPGVTGVAALAGAAALYAAGYAFWAVVAGGLGLLGVVAWLALWADTRRRRSHVRREIGHTLRGVPDAAALQPDSRGRALSRFRAQRAAVERERDAREHLAESLREARAVAHDAERAGLGSPAPGHVAARLEALIEAGRQRLARGEVELERVGEASLRLPDGVPPTDAGVSEALRSRRAERARAQEELQAVSQALLERGTPTESADALEAALASLEPRREALARKARVLEAAHALIADAYEAFRDRDQERLVGYVSRHVERLTGGRLGPVEVSDTLEDARVRLDGRSLPLHCPPLSFGEYHAVLLGVRLGASDFLAGIGIHPPLIIDEPFAHLDRERAEAVWQLIREVARERQVLITTQDTALAESLEGAALLRLGSSRPARPRRPDRATAGAGAD